MPSSQPSCIEQTPWGRCQQTRKLGGGLCPYHRNAYVLGASFRIDSYYHEKVAKGLLEPAEVYLSDVEIDAMMGGRPRNDGRRLDHFTVA